MFRLSHFIVVLAIVLVSLPQGLFAQTEVEQPGEADSILSTSEALVCSDYYQLGSVKALIEPSSTTTVNGTTVGFSSYLFNENPYPIVDGTLYVKIFKTDSATVDNNDADLVVDQFVAETGITLPAKGSYSLEHDWDIPVNAESGDYYAGYFFASNDQYHLSGLSFTDDIVGSTAPFVVVSEEGVRAPIVLSKTDTKINGQDHSFAGLPLSFDTNETVTITTTATNNSDEEITVPIQWSQYAWNALNDDNQIYTNIEVLTFAPNETKTISYEVQSQRESVVYVVATLQDLEAMSILNVRYLQNDVSEARFVFPSLTKFPVKAGDEIMAFACAQLSGATTEQSDKVTLQLVDKDGTEIYSYSSDESLANGLSIYGDSFTASQDYDYVKLVASIQYQGVVADEVEVIYDCAAIDPGGCSNAESVAVSSPPTEKSASELILITIMVVVLILIVVVLFVLFRKKGATHLMMLLLPLLLFGVGVSSVDAAGPNVTFTASSYNIISGQSSTLSWSSSNDAVSCTSPDFTTNSQLSGSVTVSPTASRTYSLSCMNLGAPMSGGSCGYADAASCNSNGCIWTNLECSVGSLSALCGTCMGGYSYSTESTTRTVTIGVSASTPPPNNAPTGPTISGPGTGVTGTSYNFTFRSTDPDGDTLYYVIDWGDGTSRSPLSGYVSSGTNGSASKSWATAGTKTINVRAIDSRGSGSGWRSHTITISAPTPPPPPPSAGVGTLNASGCTIAVGASTCNGSVTWSVPDWNPNTGNFYSFTRRVYSSVETAIVGLSGTRALALTHGANTVVLSELPVSPAIIMLTMEPQYLTATANVTCAAGSTWNNTICAGAIAPAPVTSGSCRVGTELVLNDFDGWAGEARSHPACVGLNYIAPAYGGTGTMRNLAPCPGGLTAGGNSPNGSCLSRVTFNSTAQDASRCEVFGFYCNNTPGPSCSTGAVFYNAANYGGNFNTAQSQCIDAGYTEIIALSAEELVAVDGMNKPNGTCYAVERDNFGTIVNYYYAQVPSCTVTPPPPPPPATCGPVGSQYRWNGANWDDYSVGAIGWSMTDIGMTASTPPSTYSGPQSMGYGVTWTMQGSTHVMNCGAVSNSAPYPPTIYGPTTVVAGASNSFTFTGTDPDNDDIYYELDRNNDDVDDSPSTPATGDVPSGTPGTWTNTWNTAGPYTFQARTVDAGGLMSGWTSHSVTVIAPTPPSTANLFISINGATPADATTPISPTDSVTLSWTSTDATSCTGVNFNTSNATNNPGLNVTTPPPSSVTTYTLNCTGVGGNSTDSVSVTVNALPNLTVNLGPPTLSTTFNPATGAYDSVSVPISIANTSTPTAIPFDTIIEIDRDGDGTYEEQLPAIALNGLSGTAPSIQRQFTNVLFGTATVRARVDASGGPDGVVLESNETDNVSTLNVATTPPPINMTLTIDPSDIVRSGEDATLNYDTNATFPMDCSLSGPALTTVTFDPSVSGSSGSVVAGPITAKSDYLLSCEEPITGTVYTAGAVIETTGTVEEI